jgi:hypothetical protein
MSENEAFEKYRIRKEAMAKIFNECLFVDLFNSWSELSKKDLSSFYDKIDEALINYKLITTKYVKLPEGYGNLEKFLESRLLLVSVLSVLNDPSQEVAKKFVDSFWWGKLSNKDYFNNVSVKITLPNPDDFYNLFIQMNKSVSKT